MSSSGSKEILCAIPARYPSSRFPGKPLVSIAGIPMVVRVAQTAQAVLDWVVVATDDDRIVQVCREWGVESFKTQGEFPTGTDRVASVAKALQPAYVVNVQGDEPLLPQAALRKFVEAAKASSTPVLNAMAKLTPGTDPADVTVPKVAATPQGRLVYISRSVIPNSVKGRPAQLFRQIGIYGFSNAALEAYRTFPGRGSLEASEDIEILRFLDLGMPIDMVELEDYGPAVDLPEHVPLVEARLRA